MAVSSSDSRVISLLRFPLTFAVVMQHSMGTITTDIRWTSLSGLDLYSLLKSLCSGCMALIAVPAFFFISGYLFFGNVTTMDSSVYKAKMTTRLKSLLVPYLGWNLLTVPILLLVTYGEAMNGTRTMADFTDLLHNGRWTHIFWDFSSHDALYGNLWGMHLLKDSPVLSTFWYVRDLIIMCLLSPLVYWYVTRTRWVGFWALVVLFVLRLWPHMTLGPQSLFFVFGAYASLLRGSLTTSGATLRRAIYGVAAVLFVVVFSLLGNDTYHGFLLTPAFTLAGCYAVLNLGAFFAKRHPGFAFPQLLTKSSFFVYALHMQLALPLAFFLLKKLFSGAEHPLLLALQYLLTPCLIYAICLAAYVVMQKLTPRLLAVLNGSR